MLNLFLNRKNKKVTLKEMQSLTGTLNFFGRCILPGRAFTRRLYSLTKNLTKPHHHVRLNKEAQHDMQVWLQFLEHPSVFARPFLDFSQDLAASDIEFYTDASRNFTLGAGGICQNSWFSLKWDWNFMCKNQPSIAYLELYAVTVGILLWIQRFSNRRVFLFCDNEAVVNMLNNTSSSCKHCMVLIRLIVLKSMIHNVRVYAKHVGTKENYLADWLSRDKVKLFKRITKNKFESEPEKIPSELWPMNSVW